MGAGRCQTLGIAIGAQQQNPLRQASIMQSPVAQLRTLVKYGMTVQQLEAQAPVESGDGSRPTRGGSRG